MSVISSHILDSITGLSAIGIRTQLFKLNPTTENELVFDTISDGEGRIYEMVDVVGDQEFELIFHAGAYFETAQHGSDDEHYMPIVVVRFTMKDRQDRYHIPLVLSPHSYTLWWSR